MRRWGVRWVVAIALLAGGRWAAGQVATLGTGFAGHRAVVAAAQMVPSPEEGPGWREGLHGLLGQPDVDVSLLLVGVLLIYVELNVPGVVLPGALGLLCVLLGMYGLWAFPLSPAAAMFLLAGAALFPLEAKLGGHGGLAALGTALLVYGLAHLVVGSAAMPGVHLRVALAAGLSFGVITAGLGWVAARARRGKRLMGEEALEGLHGVARTELAPEGQVWVRGELWQARLAGGRVAEGAAVVVRGRQDLLLLVEAESERQDGSGNPLVPAGQAR